MLYTACDVLYNNRTNVRIIFRKDFKGTDTNTKLSTSWKHWISQIDLRTCFTCKDNNGKIYHISETPYPKPPVHVACRCVLVSMPSIDAGEATDSGTEGADYYIKYYGRLPDNYISTDEAKSIGWKKRKGNLNMIAPGKSIGGDVYDNDDRHLPEKPGRTWYEADINYKSGYRNDQRIVYSNDGLIFATFDHYKTFMEIN